MKRLILLLAVALTTAFVLPDFSKACSRVLWKTKQGVVAARTMDWGHSFEDFLFIYPRGIEMDGGVEDGLKWTSKYGSVGCSIIGYAQKYGYDFAKDCHSDGINEKGLSAHLLYLGETVYEKPNDKPGVSYFRWIRYILDNFATVEEAVEGMREVRVIPVPMTDGKLFGVHVAVEDPSGDSAIFEFIGGNLVIHHGPEHTVMTNDPPYPFHVENLKRYKDFGGDLDLPGSSESEDRFVRLATYLKRLKEPKDSADALARILGVIRWANTSFDADEYGPTWWTSLTDVSNKVWYFDWALNPNIVWVDLKKVNFDADQPVKFVNPRLPNLVGDISGSFEPVEDE